MNKNTWNSGDTGYVAVFNPDTNLPIGEMLKYDLNKLMPTTGGTATGGSTQRLIHSKLLVVQDGMPTTTDHFLDVTAFVGNKMISTTPDNMTQGDISVNYQSSLWDIHDKNGVLLSEKQVFANRGELYTHLQTVVPNDGSVYEMEAYATVYDEINNDIQPIQKMYGINTFFHSLNNGRKLSLVYVNFSQSIWDGSEGWSDFEDWVQDLYQNTIDGSRVYQSGDERIIKSTRNYRKAFSAIHSLKAQKFEIKNNRYTYNLGGQIVSTGNSGDYSQDVSKSKYCVRQIDDPSSWEWIDWDNVGALASAQLKSETTIIACYVWENGGEYCISIKPINIDMVYLDYFDNKKYELYKIENRRDSYDYITKIDNALSKYQIGNSTTLPKNKYLPNNFGITKNGLFGIQTEFKYNFYLKELSTNQISPISRMGISFESHPKRNSTIDIKIR